MRAPALALALLSSCARGPIATPPPVTLPVPAAHADDRAVTLAAGCLLGWHEAPARDRCAELLLRGIDDPLAREIETAREIPDILVLMDHPDARARAVGILAAVQRTRDRDIDALPLFGVARTDSRRALDRLARIELAAELAGHPIVREGRTFEARERAAWASAREGFADRLRALVDRVTDLEIREHMIAAAKHLDVELRTSEIDAPVDVPSDPAVLAASCWLGTTWGNGADRRCEAFAHALYSDPEHAYENGAAIRAADPETLVALGPEVRGIAAATRDPRKIPALVDANPAIGWLFVVHRLGGDRSLTEEAELVGAVFHVRGDSWLEIFERAAKIGGHPLLPIDLVEDDSDPSDSAIRRLARASVNEAIADKLRAAPADGELQSAIRAIVDRLDAEYRAAR